LRATIDFIDCILIIEIKKLGLLDADKSATHNSTVINLHKLKENHIYLSPRELYCIKLMLKGYTAKMIAKKLSISHRTVEEYLTNARIKFGPLQSHD
jgi:DNA-binding NarL/FixJ family response regulator